MEYDKYLIFVELVRDIPYNLIHCGLGDFNEILDEYFSSQLQWLMTELPAVKLSLEECHETLLMISQHWFR